MIIAFDVDPKTRCMRWAGEPDEVTQARDFLAGLPLSPMQRSDQYRECLDVLCVNPLHEQGVAA